MIRTQIQLTEEQAAQVKRIARARGCVPPLAQRAVELVELARHVREALAVCIGDCPLGLARAKLGILCESRGFGARELGLVLYAGRRGDGAA